MEVGPRDHDNGRLDLGIAMRGWTLGSLWEVGPRDRYERFLLLYLSPLADGNGIITGCFQLLELTRRSQRGFLPGLHTPHSYQGEGPTLDPSETLIPAVRVVTDCLRHTQGEAR